MMTVVGRANAICGRMMPGQVVGQAQALIKMYSGVIATVIGNIRPAANSAYIAARPEKL
jgi:hypothetical protein